MLQFSYMEGTRNEKALLVLCSYVIGFVTAYIAYGITYTTFSEVAVTEGDTYTASVSAAADTTPAANGVSYVLDDAGLTVNVNGEERLLSVNAATLTPEEIATLGAPGVYETMNQVSVSSDGSEVFYCEQFPGESVCTPYVYSVANDSIRPVDSIPAADPVAL